MKKHKYNPLTKTMSDFRSTTKSFLVRKKNPERSVSLAPRAGKTWGNVTKRLVKDAARYLVGGVNSPVRSFYYVGGDPLVVQRGAGAYLYDHDENKYLDYVLSWGAAILGHAHPRVVRAINRAARNGVHFGTTTFPEIEIAKTIQAAIPFIENIRFVNSGTEAVMGAVRLARGYTGRDVILKFEQAYHGHADYLLAKAGSGLATLGIPSSRGVPEDFTKNTLIAPSGNFAAVEEIFKTQGKRIAAVLVEPVGGNFGVVPPDKKFLSQLRGITEKYGTLLIFDEVITGFRFHYGAVAEILNITPDLITLGKIIGGGLPVGAFGGKKDIMRRLAPLGDVYQASTFAGNPVVMAAGLSTLKTLAAAEKEYSRIEKLTGDLSSGLARESEKNNVDLQVRAWGSMFSLRFREKKFFQKFYRLLLKQGVYFAPSEFEANFLSFSHTQKDVARTVAVAVKAFRGLRDRKV